MGDGLADAATLADAARADEIAFEAAFDAVALALREYADACRAALESCAPLRISAGSSVAQVGVGQGEGGVDFVSTPTSANSQPPILPTHREYDSTRVGDGFFVHLADGTDDPCAEDDSVYVASRADVDSLIALLTEIRERLP